MWKDFRNDIRKKLEGSNNALSKTRITSVERQDQQDRLGTSTLHYGSVSSVGKNEGSILIRNKFELGNQSSIENESKLSYDP